MSRGGMTVKHMNGAGSLHSSVPRSDPPHCSQHPPQRTRRSSLQVPPAAASLQQHPLAPPPLLLSPAAALPTTPAPHRSVMPAGKTDRPLGRQGSPRGAVQHRHPQPPGAAAALIHGPAADAAAQERIAAEAAATAAAAAQRGFAAAAAAVPAATPPSAAHKPRRVTKAERLHLPAVAPAARRCMHAPSPAPAARRPSPCRRPRLLAFSSACGLTLAAACTVVAGIWCCPHHSPPTAPYHVAAAAGLP